MPGVPKTTMPSRNVWWHVCPEKSGHSTVLFLAHSSPTWASRLYLRQIYAWGKLWSELPHQANPIVIQFEQYQLRKMGASPFRDMLSLSTIHTEAMGFMRFIYGNFAVHKISRVFSSMALDQAHEQNNAAIKVMAVLLDLLKPPRLLDTGWSLVLN